MQLTTDHWQYTSSKPLGSAVFKQELSDFQVIESLGYSLTGNGEHIYVELEKTGLNTAFVAEQLAKYCQLPLRQVTYAGRKDKFAVTRQWFGIHLPGKENIDWQGFQLPGTNIVQAIRHNKKLRTGQLAGNRFVITLRNATHLEDITQRLDLAAKNGVANYYGSQRFGVQRLSTALELQQGGNLALAERMLNGETIKNRNKRSMALSALRSWLFNQMLSERIAQQKLFTILPGDVINLTGSNSIFVAEEDFTLLQNRLKRQDISTTVPLWGSGESSAKAQALAMESACVKNYSAITEFLSRQRLTFERRAAIIWPQHLECTCEGDTLIIQFFLPAGCFATSVLRECVNTVEQV